MITVNNLTFAYPGLRPSERPAPVLSDLSLTLDKGQAMAVMGASGAGKSTLAHLIAGLIPRYTGGTVEGELIVEGHDVKEAPLPVGTAGLLFQDAATQLFNTTVEEEIAWGLEAMGMPSPRIEARINQALDHFGLQGLRRRQPWALSGGEQKRLALAAVWAMQPQIFVLDEPLGGLDPQGRSEVLRAMRALRQAGSAVLAMTHHAEVARDVQRVALLEGGHLTRADHPASMLSQTAALIAAGVLFPPDRWPDLGPHAGGSGADSMPPIAVEGLFFGYPEGPEVLHDLSLTVPPGQFVAIVGPNGGGKSTLVRHFNGLLHPTRGTVRIMGDDTAQRSTGALARHVGFLFQRPEQQLFAPTVREEIAYGPEQLALARGEAALDRVMARFSLTDLAESPPALLSYGAQRAVTLASLAILQTPIVVLDEPTVGLDGRGTQQLLSWMADLRKRSATLIVVTHELALAERADRVVAIEGGRIVADGDLKSAADHLGWDGAAR